jgi:hypothetical protein
MEEEAVLALPATKTSTWRFSSVCCNCRRKEEAAAPILESPLATFDHNMLVDFADFFIIHIEIRDRCSYTIAK